MPLIQARSIHALFTGAALLLALVVSGYFVIDRVYTTQASLESDTRERVEELISVVDAYWGHRIATGSITDIQTSVSNMMASGNYQTIALLDQQDRVLAAARLDWVKQPVLMYVSNFNSRDAERARSGWQRVVRHEADSSFLQAYIPIPIREQNNELRIQGSALLFIEYDLTGIKREKRQQAALHIGGFMLVLMLVFGLFWLTLHRFLQQRLTRLLGAARRMGAGDLDARTGLTGSDELSELGATFDDMASRLAGERAELLRRQSAMAESERKYRMLFNDSRDGIALLDSGGQFVDANQRYLELLGYSIDELRHLNYSDITPAKWHAIEAQIVENQLYKRGYTDEYEKEYIDRSGRVFPVSIKASLMYGEYGEVIGMWGTIRDISERKQAEAKLLLAARVFENSGEGIVITGIEPPVRTR